MAKFLGIALIAALGALVVRQLLPDIQRYQRISSM
ncbi:MAG: DUF6893 family small protein [Ktedonobacterales bacterium]